MREFNHPETQNPNGGRDLGQITLKADERICRICGEIHTTGHEGVCTECLQNLECTHENATPMGPDEHHGYYCHDCGKYF